MARFSQRAFQGAMLRLSENNQTCLNCRALAASRFQAQRYKKILSPANFKASIIEKFERFSPNLLHLI
jgi:hypothetical protein